MEQTLLSDPLLLPLDDLFVDGDLQCQGLLDLHQFLVVRPQPLNLLVEQTNLALFRLDLMMEVDKRLNNPDRLSTNLRPEGCSLLLQLPCKIRHLNDELKTCC